MAVVMYPRFYRMERDPSPFGIHPFTNTSGCIPVLRRRMEFKLGSSSSSNNNNNNNQVQFLSSSGGNAGLALTTVCRSLRPPLPVSVIVPETTKPMVVRNLETLGADVTVFGKNWNEADALARTMVEDAKTDGSGNTVYYVSPYDNPLLWTGHSTAVDEIIDQLSCNGGDDDVRIGAILASVGGGGLLSGILEGLERNYYRGGGGGGGRRSEIIRGTKVMACETEGAASFAASLVANSLDSENNSNDDDDGDGNGNGNANEERSLTMKRLDGITSVATSLGALEVTPAVIHRAHRHQRRGRCDDTSAGGGEDVLSYTCTDAEAVDACVKFALDHRMLVEPACGAALAPIYSERLRGRLLEELSGMRQSSSGDGDRGSSAIVVEVCGGSGVSAELLMEWKKQFLE